MSTEEKIQGHPAERNVKVEVSSEFLFEVFVALS